MKQIYHPYHEWEGFKNGMYNECKEGRSDRVSDARYLLTRPNLLYKNMVAVTREWVNETEHVLTDQSINHRAWLGQAACNYWGGIKEDETREAWGFLTDRQRKEANAAADKAAGKWRAENDPEAGYQLSLFGGE